jgi:hypothetical protein
MVYQGLLPGLAPAIDLQKPDVIAGNGLRTLPTRGVACP